MKGMGIVIAGVGGQGTLVAGRIIGGAAMKQGFDVKVSEVHGMAKRGGSVITFVKFDKKQVYAPVIAPGEADTVLAFERLEAYRSVEYLKMNGRIIINSQEIEPIPVLMGTVDYPKDIAAKLLRLNIKVEELDALGLAKKAGNIRAVNVALIGRLAAAMDFPKKIWLDTIKETVKPSFLKINLKAFELGYEAL